MPLTALIQAAWDHRRDYVEAEKLEAFRLVNGAGDGLPGLTVDAYAGRYLMAAEARSWQGRQNSLREALERWHAEMAFPGPAKFFWASRADQEGASSDAMERFEVGENCFRFEVHLGEGPHTGLFLDQRENRRRVASLAPGRLCLNLFAYTGAFSVAAVKGGATQTVSVELSKTTLQWLKRNLALNRLPSSRSTEIAADVFHYLIGAISSSERFDLIILDPPTFSRSRSKVFSTQRDFGKLVRDCARLLQPEGRMLVSLNTRKIAPPEFRDTIKSALQPLGRKILEAPSLPADFRLGAEERKNPPVKFCWVG